MADHNHTLEWRNERLENTADGWREACRCIYCHEEFVPRLSDSPTETRMNDLVENARALAIKLSRGTTNQRLSLDEFVTIQSLCREFKLNLLKLSSCGLVSVTERMPEKNQLVLAYLSGVKGHSDVMWKREGWWLVPWHGTVWAWQFIDAACKHLDADTLEVTHWMLLPEPPK